MAVVSADPYRDGPRGFKEEKKEGFTVPWKVVVDDEKDGPITVWNAPGLPSFGDSFAWGNDPASARATLVRFTVPVRVGKLTWKIEAIYEFEDSSEEPGAPELRDENGDKTDDPTAAIQVIPGSVEIPRLVRDAKFQGVFRVDDGTEDTAATPKFSKGTIGPIANSAGVPVIPAVEDSEYLPTLRIKTWVSNWNSNFTTIEGKVNSDEVTIEYWPFAYSEIFSPRELFVKKFSASPYYFNNVPYYEVTTEFWIKYGGWFHLELDRGTMVSVPDADKAAGSAGASYERIVDSKRRPVSEKVLFDGSGGPLSPNEPNLHTYARHLRFDIKEETPMQFIINLMGP